LTRPDFDFDNQFLRFALGNDENVLTTAYKYKLRRSKLTFAQDVTFQSPHGLTNLSSLPFKCHLLRSNEDVRDQGSIGG
jgi:hypothetical protein